MVADIIHIINLVLTRTFDALHWPASLLSPFWALTVMSILAGIVMLLIFGKVSNQAAIKEIKNKIRANLIAIRLFNDDVPVLLKIQGRILRETLFYMKFTLIPICVMILPVLIILIQLNLRYDARPIEVGEHVLVKVKVMDGSLLSIPSNLTLTADAGVAIETLPVRVLPDQEISWRIRGRQPGKHKIVVRIGNHTVEKEVFVGSPSGRVSRLRVGLDFFDMLLNPGEPPIEKATNIRYVQVNYPPLDIEVFGWKINWLVQFFILSIASGYLLKGFFGIDV